MNFKLNYLKKSESVLDRLRSLKKNFNYDITIVGSYNTINAGDKILCDAAASYFSNKGFKVNIQSKRKITSFKSELVIVCGGDILHDNNQRNLNWLKKLLKLNAKVVFLGVGVPGFYLTKKLDVFNLLSKIQYIVTRDEKSFNRLNKVNLTNLFNGVDNAFLIKDLLKKNTLKENDEVILNIKEFKSASIANEWLKSKGNQPVEKSDYLNFITSLIRYYKSRGISKISALPMTIEDEVFTRKNFKDDVDYIYNYTSDFHQISLIISGVREVFTTRYHFHILSLINKKTIICYAYADKVENINDEIKNFKYISRRDIEDYQDLNFESLLNYHSEYEIGIQNYMMKLEDELKYLDELL